MTLEELKTKCEQQGFQYAYGSFKQEVEPPHIVVKEIESNNFMADDKVYKKKVMVQLDYTYLDKNVEEQNKVSIDMDQLENTESVEAIKISEQQKK